MVVGSVGGEDDAEGPRSGSRKADVLARLQMVVGGH